MEAPRDMVIDRDPTTLDDNSLDSAMGFEGTMCVIAVGDKDDGKYACNNATTPPPDPMEANGLAVFHNKESAEMYMGSLNGLSGEVVEKTLEECRQIAMGKPRLNALFFMIGPIIVKIHFIR